MVDIFLHLAEDLVVLAAEETAQIELELDLLAKVVEAAEAAEWVLIVAHQMALAVQVS